jgi:hypothetical protein
MGERIKIDAKKPLSTKENSASHKQKTDFRSQGSHVDRILFLQRTIGNQAVQRLIKSGALQAKLRIGQPGDKYEQEADRVADEVMRMPEPGVQRQVEPEEEEEEEILQTKPLVDQITPVVQRQVEEEEEEEMLQAKSREDATSEVTNELESQINAIKGGGRPLAESERGFFEPRFGYDFGQVRVHTDARAAETARALDARAYTMGRNIAFRAGQYAPETTIGKRLLAHELTHVIQQNVHEAAVNKCIAPIKHASSTPIVQKYDERVHLDLTYNLASAPGVGFTPAEARIIADEDQGVDAGWTHPHFRTPLELLNPFVSGQDMIHFPARSVAIAAVNQAIGRCDIRAFGRALHRFQDSYSHSFPRGEPYSRDHLWPHHAPYGRLAVIKHARPGMRGDRGYGTYPDQYNIDTTNQGARDTEMRRGSRRWLQRFHHAWYGICRTRVPVPPGLRPPSLIFGPAHVGPYIRRE